MTWDFMDLFGFCSFACEKHENKPGSHEITNQTQLCQNYTCTHTAEKILHSLIVHFTSWCMFTVKCWFTEKLLAERDVTGGSVCVCVCVCVCACVCVCERERERGGGGGGGSGLPTG